MKKNALGLVFGLALIVNPLVTASAKDAAATAADGAAQTQAAAPEQAMKAKYSSATTKLGVLLDDPASRAILETNVPSNLFANPAVPMFRGMTLKQLQSFAPIILADDVLAKIDSDFAKLGA